MLLWQPKGNVNRKVGELPGHSAGISQLVVADEQSQVGWGGRWIDRGSAAAQGVLLLRIHVQAGACCDHPAPASAGHGEW